MSKQIASRRAFLETLTFGTLAGTIPRWALANSKQQQIPNIVFILADDLGYSELGCYGNTFNETPNLDKLARRGMRFTNAYAAAPVCSPYRASLMSGQYPARIGITDYLRPDSPKHFPEDCTSLAEAFQQAGYRTGIVGKWHLTGYEHHGAYESSPNKHGFDEVLVPPKRGIGSGSYFHPYHFNPAIEKRLPGNEHLTDRCNLEALEFIDRNHDKPFFLYLSHFAVHTRLEGKPGLVKKYEAKPGAGKSNKAKKNNPHLAAQLESIDEGVGQIMKKLKEHGILDHTLVIFTSDNGGEDRVTTNMPLRAGKSTLYEGGIREPLIVYNPKTVKPGTICDTPVCSIDFYPTLCSMANIKTKPSQKIDGISFSKLLRDPASNLNRDNLYWHYPLEKPHFLGGRSAGAVRSDHWKLIEFFDTGDAELYDLSSDEGEMNNQAKEKSEITRKLLNQLRAWREDVGAKI